MGKIKLDEILTEERLLHIEGFFVRAIEAINEEWDFREYFNIKINTIDEGIFKEISVVIQIYNSQNPNKENIAEVRFSRNGIPFSNWTGNYFDFTLCVELDLTEANVNSCYNEETTKKAHKSYFTFEELALLDSAVAVAADKFANEDYNDEELDEEELDELDERGIPYKYERMMEIIGLKTGVIDRNALSEINLYSIVAYAVYNVASMVGCSWFNKLTIHHDTYKFYVMLEECDNLVIEDQWVVKNYFPFKVSSHSGHKMGSGEMCYFNFKLAIVEPKHNFTANQLTLLDNAAKLILSEFTKMDRIKYLMGKLDSERWGTFFVNSQKLSIQDAVNYWKEVEDKDRKTCGSSLLLYSWEDYKNYKKLKALQ